MGAGGEGEGFWGIGQMLSSLLRFSNTRCHVS